MGKLLQREFGEEGAAGTLRRDSGCGISRDSMMESDTDGVSGLGDASMIGEVSISMAFGAGSKSVSERRREQLCIPPTGVLLVLAFNCFA